MTRAVVPLALLAALATSVPAGATTWQFEYTGLNDPDASFNILSTATGSFTAEDLDHNGVLTASEVSALSFLDYQVAPVAIGWSPWGDLPSRLDAFHYTIGTQDLRFDAFSGSYGDSIDIASQQMHWITGIGDFHYDLGAAGVALSISALSSVGPATIPAPVPEPSTWALASLGLVALAVARRRAPKR